MTFIAPYSSALISIAALLLKLPTKKYIAPAVKPEVPAAIGTEFCAAYI
jgi:hypothetical protein